MVELIKKGALSEEIESLTVHVTGLRAGKGVLSNFMDEYRKSVLRIIDEQPTTTEAEIRAKAYERFAEKLKESLLKNYRHFITTDTDGFDWLTTDAVGTHIDKVVDQLKEE